MKSLSPLQIHKRINKLSFLTLGRKNTEKENTRIFWMNQVLIKMENDYHNELKKQSCKLKIGDRLI